SISLKHVTDLLIGNSSLSDNEPTHNNEPESLIPEETSQFLFAYLQAFLVRDCIITLKNRGLALLGEIESLQRRIKALLKAYLVHIKSFWQDLTQTTGTTCWKHNAHLKVIPSDGKEDSLVNVIFQRTDQHLLNSNYSKNAIRKNRNAFNSRKYHFFNTEWC
ncbi:MAG TPA: hypothetical protein VJ720_01535, partial [Chitinophaga sp.]|nr:hypothetical protein [Chitinophaga sp.]